MAASNLTGAQDLDMQVFAGLGRQKWLNVYPFQCGKEDCQHISMVTAIMHIYGGCLSVVDIYFLPIPLLEQLKVTETAGS